MFHWGRRLFEKGYVPNPPRGVYPNVKRGVPDYNLIEVRISSVPAGEGLGGSLSCSGKGKPPKEPVSSDMGFWDAAEYAADCH